MKKIVLMLLTFLFLIFCGCSTNEDNNIDFWEAMQEAQGNVILQDIEYWSFEEVIEHSTHIIVGEYVEAEMHQNSVDYKFLIKKQLKGTVKEDYLYVNSFLRMRCSVHGETDVLEFNNDDIAYEAGKSYILVLSKSVSVYYEHDNYLLMHGCFLPIENISRWSMYGNQPLNEHSDTQWTDRLSANALLNYISAEIAKNPVSKEEFLEDSYIVSQNKEDIIAGSPYVVKLLPLKEVEVSSLAEHIQRYKCIIVTQYKGNIETPTIEVTFKAGTVSLNTECIVALKHTGIKDLYEFTAKNSLMLANEEAEIQAILNEVS